jgi:peptide deformylase
MRFLVTVVLMVILTGCAGSGKIIVTDPFDLRTVSEKVDKVKADDKLAIEDLKNVLKSDKNLFAISAPAIGHKKRLIVFRKGETYDVMLNPEIIGFKGQKNTIETSIVTPGITSVISRFENVTVLYTDLNGKEHEYIATGQISVELQQQIDLLNGVLIFDVAKHIMKGE